jgi:polar amino acid transport system substrate-binding protein
MRQRVLAGASCAVVMGTLMLASAQTQGVQTPSRLLKTGEVVYCTEVGFPPLEFFPENSKEPAGFDIDLGNELAKRLGVKARWENTGFDGIIAALQSRKCDAIISGLSRTTQREAQVRFVTYLQNNRAIVVQKGNPAKISSFNDLCGKAVGAQVGSANYEDMVKLVDKCKADAKPAMTLRSFPNDAALRLALLSNQIDAYNQSAMPAAWAVKQSSARLEIAAVSEQTNYIGIAFRRDDVALHSAVQKLVKTMYQDGSMNRLLQEWELTPFRLRNP